MTPAGGARLVVSADLSIRVTDPRGRTASVVVDDHGGVVRVRVAQAADLGVLLGSVPLPRPGGRGTDALRSLLPGPEQEGPRWDQDVEVLLGQRLLLRRRGGRWRPTSTALAPAALVVATTATMVAFAVVLLGQALRAAARRRRGGGATG